MPAGGDDVSVGTGGSLQRHQEALLRGVAGAVAGDCCQEAQRQTDTIDYAEDCTADQLQAWRRAVECHYSYRERFIT